MSSHSPSTSKRIVVMPAYNAARTLQKTCARIPAKLGAHIVVCDDASQDDTVRVARELGLEVIEHPRNRGYGGAQKTLYARALELGADTIVMLHPDNQYEAERLTELVRLVEEDGFDFALGSRIADGKAGERGMPIWKRIANRALTTMQNRTFGTHFTDLHTGLRAYRAATLRRIGWQSFPNDFGFDCEMLVDLCASGLRGGEVAIGSWYFEDASSVNLQTSIRYGRQVLKSLKRYPRVVARLQMENGS